MTDSSRSSTPSSSPLSSPLLSHDPWGPPYSLAFSPELERMATNIEAPAVSSSNEPLPAAPERKTVECRHTFLATSALLNLSSGLIIGGLGAGHPGGVFAKVVGITCTVVFVISFLLTACAVVDVWPRTCHTRLLGGVLGFGVMAAAALVLGGWNNGYQSAFWVIGGCYLGFIVESVTGFLFWCIQLLANLGEEEERPERCLEGVSGFEDGTGKHVRAGVDVLV